MNKVSAMGPEQQKVERRRENNAVPGCWANVLAVGASHRAHSHRNNFLSGIYYLRTAAGAETINFHDPRVQPGIIRPAVSELTAETKWWCW
jgi:uncharacterized protein (TIGR02466 family)